MWYLSYIANQKNVPAMLSDTLANIPASAVLGALFIATDTQALYRWDGSTWVLIGGPGTGTITGSGTANQVAYFTASGVIASNTAFQFNGTTVTVANDALINGLTVGKGLGNIVTNTAFGIDALDSNTTGYSNVAIGNKALNRNTTGFLNIAIGNQAIENSQAGYANVAIGDFALNELSTGYYNIAIGRNALTKNTTAFTNIAIGDGTLRQTTTGYSNVAVGNNALFTNLTGIQNTALGVNAGSHVIGSNNIIIGINAGNDPTLTGNTNDSIFIGNTAQPAATGQTNQIVIGVGATGNGSNTVTLGNTSIVNTYLQGTVNASHIAVTKTNSGIALNITDSANGNALNINKTGSGYAVNVAAGDTNLQKVFSTGYYLDNGNVGSGALYYNLAANRITLANYTTNGIVRIEVSGGNTAVEFNANLTSRFLGQINGTEANFGTATLYNSTKIQASGTADAAITSVDVSGATSFIRILADVGSQNLINWQTGTALRFAVSQNNFTSYVEYSRFSNIGNLLIGTATDNLNDKLQVNGSVDALFYRVGGVPIVGYGTTTAQFAPNNFWQQTDIFSNGSVALSLNSSLNATFSGSIKTSNPTSGTAQPWKLGSYVAVAAPAPTGYIEIDINGTLYKVAAGT